MSDNIKSKNCIYCGELVRKGALICKYCHKAIEYNKFKGALRILHNWSHPLAVILSAITLLFVALNSIYTIKKIQYDLQELQKAIIPHFETEAVDLYIDPTGRGEDSTQVWSGVVIEFVNFVASDFYNVEITKCDIKLPRGLVKKEDMWGRIPLLLNLPKANPPNVSRVRIIAPFTEAKWVVQDYKNGKQSFSVDIVASYYYIYAKGKKGSYKYRYIGEYRNGKFELISKGEVK